MVADSMQRFGVARETVQSEASSLGNVFQNRRRFAKRQREQTSRSLRQYASEVINDE